MKRFITLLSICLILIFSGIILWRRFKPLPKLPKSSVVNHIPESCAFIVKFQSMSKLYKLIERNEKELWNPTLKSLSTSFPLKVLDELLLPLDSLTLLGINTTKEIGITAHGVKSGFDHSSSTIGLFIPIDDSATVITQLKAHFDIEFKKIIDTSRTYSYASLIGTEDSFEKFALFKNGYLWIVLGSTISACEITLDQIYGAKGVSQHPTYSLLEKEIGTNRDIFFYANYEEALGMRGFVMGFLQSVIPNFKETIVAHIGAQLLQIKKNASLCSFDISDSTLYGEVATTTSKKATTTPYPPFSMAYEQFSKTPLLLGSFRANTASGLRGFNKMLHNSDPMTKDTTLRALFFDELATIITDQFYVYFNKQPVNGDYNLEVAITFTTENKKKTDSLFTHYLDLQEENPLAPFSKTTRNKKELFQIIIFGQTFYITHREKTVFITNSEILLSHFGKGKKRNRTNAKRLKIPYLRKNFDTYLAVDLKELLPILTEIQQQLEIPSRAPKYLTHFGMSQEHLSNRVVSRLTLQSTYKKGFLREFIHDLGNDQ